MRPLMTCGILLGGVLFLTGCGSSKDGHAGGGKAPGTDEHDHPEVGPHGGIIVEIHEGKEEAYHAEFVKDDTTHTFTLYLLDIKVKDPVATDQKEIALKLSDGGESLKFTLPAAPQKDDPEGKSSRFQLVDEKLCATYNKKGVKGEFDVKIGDKPHLVPYTAPGEEAHDKK